MQVTYAVRDYFFDRKRVQDRVDAGRRKALSMGGAWIRKRARSLLRSRKRASRPGEPPSVHDPKGLREIYFVWDDQTKTCVVGPVKFNQVTNTGSGRTTVPRLMEFGGTVQMQLEARANGKPWSKKVGVWRRRDLRRGVKPWMIYRRGTANYKARPFMGPALADTLPTLPETVRDLMAPR
jgi:hypothetical protein